MSPAIIHFLLTVCLTLLLANCTATQPLPPPSVTVNLSSTTSPSAPTLAPSATSTLQPAPTRTLRSLPTPIPMKWLVPVLQFDWSESSSLEFARWVDERTFSFQSPLGQYHQVSLDDQGNMTLSEPVKTNQPLSFSPHRQFLAECSASELSLYRLPERQLVGRAALAVPDTVDFMICNQYIQWSADDSALVITIYATASDSRPQTLYYWKTDQSQPRRLVTIPGYFGSSMSPNFKRLAYVAGWATQPNDPGALEALLLDIHEIDSGKVIQLRLKPWGWEAYPGWLTDQVLAIRMGMSTTAYYDAYTGQYLFPFYDSWAGQDIHQFPAVSPNQRWVTLDHTQRDNFDAKRYSLYDLQTQTEILLTDSPSSRLSFGGWKPDSSLLYLVNSPNQPFAPVDSPLPAGLLAYDPLARHATVLVPDAVRAFWSPDMRFAWVFRQSITSQAVLASLYKAASGKLSGEYYASLTPVKGDPAWDLLGLDFELRWSHDSTRALLVNARKELFLLTGSEARLLATGSYRPVSWSPYDHYALVYYARGAWVVELTK